MDIYFLISTCISRFLASNVAKQDEEPGALTLKHGEAENVSFTYNKLTEKRVRF